MCLEMVGIITKFWCSNTHHWAVEENHVRTSGRAGQLACQISRSRIIPACAENSANEAPGAVGHPRACRASSTRASRPGKLNGSSPHLRRVIHRLMHCGSSTHWRRKFTYFEKLECIHAHALEQFVISLRNRVCGFIPAHAGEILVARSSFSNWLIPDHTGEVLHITRII